MLLSCCLMHISIVIPRHFLYLSYLCRCLDLGLFTLYLCDIFFIFIFIFIMVNRMNTDALVLPLRFQNMSYYFWMITWMKNVQSQGANFSLALRVKVLLKGVISLFSIETWPTILQFCCIKFKNFYYIMSFALNKISVACTCILMFIILYSHHNALILSPIKTPDNQKFSGIFRGYERRALARNGLKGQILKLDYYSVDKYSSHEEINQLSVLKFTYKNLERLLYNKKIRYYLICYFVIKKVINVLKNR